MPNDEENSAQNLHRRDEPSSVAPFSRGDRVLARGQRWRIAGIESYSACALVRLTGIESENRSTEARLLSPFDRPRRLEAATRPRRVSCRRWRLALTALASSGALRVAAAAGIDILPHQLDPALLLLRGGAARLLLADAVGLGKTVQAGLAIAELLAAGRVHRVLILTPAGLREQWVDELGQRFQIDAQIVDQAALRGRVRMIPRSVNPWRTWTVAVVSTDFAKRSEVLTPLVEADWDVLVVDEAHGVAAAPERHEAVARLARRAPYVLLLTATPHDGDEQRFSLLTSLGRHDADEEMVVMRRTRRDAGMRDDRRVHLLSVHLTEAERRMHRTLSAYVRRVTTTARRRRDPDAVLAMIVLTKRALSGAASLVRSLDRRVALLAMNEPARGIQIALPLDVGADREIDPLDEAPDAVLAHAGLDDADQERVWLQRVRASAADATACDSKLRVVRTLLRRTSEPVVVFTEYRDTLHTLEAALHQYRPLVMHGGVDARQRAAVANAFRHGARRLLLATDVAAEGLNLHTNCRIVVSLELPWTPARLEQRIGRVDRVGQTRRVHAVNILARGTAETGVLARLLRRLNAIRDRLGDVSTPLGFISDESILDAALTGRAIHVSRTARPTMPQVTKAAMGWRGEAARLIQCRRLWLALARSTAIQPRDVINSLEISRPWLAIERSRSGFPGGLVFVFRIRVSDSQAFDDVLVSLVVSTPFHPPPCGLRRLVRQLTPALTLRAEREAIAHAQPALERARTWRDRIARREIAIQSERTPRKELSQQQLFRRSLDVQTTPVADARVRVRERSVQETRFEPAELLLVLAHTR